MKPQKSKTSLLLVGWMMDVGIKCKLGKFSILLLSVFKGHLGCIVSVMNGKDISLVMSNT